MSGRQFVMCLVGLAAGLVLLALMFPPQCTRGTYGPIIQCQANLRQICAAVLLYQNEHHGQNPASLEEILHTQDIEADCFFCPRSGIRVSNDWPAADRDAIIRRLSSFIYLGAKLNSKSAPGSILLVERPDSPDHFGKYHVAHADGSVVAVDRRDIEPLLPLPTPTTMPGSASP